MLNHTAKSEQEQRFTKESYWSWHPVVDKNTVCITVKAIFCTLLLMDYFKDVHMMVADISNLLNALDGT